MKWSRKYDKCIKCGTTERKHRGLGLCSLCLKRREIGYKGIIGHGHWNKNLSITKCIKCGTNERPHESKGMCKRCYQASRRPKRILKSKIFICEQCRKEFRQFVSNKRFKHIFCSNECFRKWNHGSNAVTYRDGKSLEKYPPEFDSIKETIRARDGYKCQMCGVPQIECERRLAVHHINYRKHDLSSKNLISLCVRCHGKTFYDRHKWMEYFDIKKFIETGERVV